MSMIHPDAEYLAAPAAPVEAPPARRLPPVLPALAAVLFGLVLGAGTVHALDQSSTTAGTTSPASVGTSSDTVPGTGLFPNGRAFRGGFGGATGNAGSPLGNSAAGNPAAGNMAAGNSVGTGPADAASIAGKVNPAVVDILATLGYEGAEAAGTGIVLTPTGEILTNNHVISGATSIAVTDVGNGRTYPAVVVGYDKTADVAVLQLTGASGLATASIASTAAKVGDQVVGVGNAGGVGGTPSYAGGVIQATGQTITASSEGDGTAEQLADLLETDAAIISGDSGGPLVNSAGQVVGLDTAASTGFRFSGTSQGFAIPIANALGVARDIEAGHASDAVHLGPTPMLGIGVEPDAFSGGGSGAVIADVLSGGPADAAGLAGGDTIVAIGGTEITSAEDLSRVVLSKKPGTTVTVHYVDASGKARSAAVQLVAGAAQ